MNLSGRKVLVTGATGFIGARLVEVLAREHRCAVRALLRNLSSAPRIARFPVELVRGDVADEDAVCRAAAGCDVIIHAAHGTSGGPGAQRAVTVRGTEAVMKAARKNRVGRVVHFSTVSVYGLTGDGDLTETSRRGRPADAYARNKRAAEEAALAHHRRHGVPVAVVQPTVVYGPFAGSWTVAPLSALHWGRLVIPAGGDGLCNAVYVDDVVQAALLAAVRPEAVGQTFLVSAEAPATWRQFYEHYEEMLGEQSLIEMTEAEFRRASRFPGLRRVGRDFARLIRHPSFICRVRGNRFLRVAYGMGRAMIPRRVREWLMSFDDRPRDGAAAPKPLHLPDGNRFRWQQARTAVRIEKARGLLGYEPRFDLARGMERTHAWASWANLPGVRPPAPPVASQQRHSA